MAGRNQHYIPQFYLRPFAAHGKGKLAKAWVVARDAAPYLDFLKRIGADTDFYSGPSEADGATLDDLITARERRPLEIVTRLRTQGPGPVEDDREVAELLSHMIPRGATIRTFVQSSTLHLMDRAEILFTDNDRSKEFLGVSTARPDQFLQNAIRSEVERSANLLPPGLPSEVVERMLFMLLREGYDEAFQQMLPAFSHLFNELRSLATTESVQNIHNKSLERLEPALGSEKTPDGKLWGSLGEFAWSVVITTFGKALLPDCIAICLDRQGKSTAYLTSELAQTACVVVPLAPDRLLIGTRQDCDSQNLDAFNEAAAACSSTFFVSAEETSRLSDWGRLIGSREREQVSSTISQVIGDDSNRGPTLPASPCPSFSYDVSFPPETDPEVAQRIAKKLGALIEGIAMSADLSILEQVVFLNERSVSVESIPRSKTQRFRVEGALKTIVYLGIDIAEEIDRIDISKPNPALQAVVAELMEVDFLQRIESGNEGLVLGTLLDAYNSTIYSPMDNALIYYFRERGSLPFGGALFRSPKFKREFRDVIGSFASEGNSLRVEYANSSEIDVACSGALKVVGEVLSLVAAYLAGLAESSCETDQDEFDHTLQEFGLLAWSKVFQEDLDRIWKTLGRDTRVQELQAFTNHVERLLWQIGFVPWQSKSGDTLFAIGPPAV